jgi:hypothetical protein
VAIEFGIAVNPLLLRERSHRWWDALDSCPHGWPAFLESVRLKVFQMVRELLLLKTSKPTHFLFAAGNPTVELRICSTHDGLAAVRRELHVLVSYIVLSVFVVLTLLVVHSRVDGLSLVMRDDAGTPNSCKVSPTSTFATVF